MFNKSPRISALPAELAAGLAEVFRPEADVGIVEVLNPEGATGVDDTRTDEAAVLLRYGCVGWTVGVTERDVGACRERVKEGDAD
jgi:hypothetical protein